MVTERLRSLALVVEALLDRIEEQPEFVSASPAEQDLFREATAALRAGGAERLDQATPHLWAYYQFMVAEIGPGGTGLPDIRAAQDVWEHVELPRVPAPALGRRPLAPSPCYLVFEGEVAWEVEHGLILVFDHSATLRRVDEYDGHLTLASALRDPSLLDVVFGGT